MCEKLRQDCKTFIHRFDSDRRLQSFQFATTLEGLHNPAMNKRAKKRLKETIEKENLERAKVRNEQNPSSAKEYQERRGFTPKPAKKRG